MKKRRIPLTILVILITPIIIFLFYLFLSSFCTKINAYYISEANIYIKSEWKPREKYGFLLFGDNPNFITIDSADYIKVYLGISSGVFLKPKNDTIWVNNPIELAINYSDGNIQYEYKETNQPKKIHSKKYVIIDQTNTEAPLLFDKNDEQKISFIKEPYIEIFISENFSSLWMRKSNDSIFTELKPL